MAMISVRRRKKKNSNRKDVVVASVVISVQNFLLEIEMTLHVSGS